MTPTGRPFGEPAAAPARPVALRVLIAILALETLAIAAVAVWLLIELLTTRAGSIGGGIAIVVLAVIATAWAASTTVAARRIRTWMRGSALTLQLILIAVAIGAFQGQYAQRGIGWALLAPALVAIGMLFAPSVVTLTRRDPQAL